MNKATTTIIVLILLVIGGYFLFSSSSDTADLPPQHPRSGMATDTLATSTDDMATTN